MNIKIKHQLVLAFILISALSILISAFLIGQSSITASKSAIQVQVEQKLIAARDLKKSQIEAYFTLLQNQIRIASSAPWVISAAEHFSQAFIDYAYYAERFYDESRLKSYYHRDFKESYKSLNNGSSANVDGIIKSLSKPARYLQHTYIAANPNELGSKDALTISTVPSSYDSLHQEYHPTFRKFLQTYGYYDIFIVDANNGHIVYSVFKELDFGTSLLKGPYKDSGLAEAYQAGLNLKSPNDTALIDFKPYLPSYNAAASFIASPIVQNDTTVGILIFQMPIDGINEIMTSRGKWQEAGFGDSGETYLIGPDQLLRSQSRFLMEDADGYMTALKNSTESSVLAKIRASGSAIGLQKIATKGSDNILQGNTGVAYFNDYRNVPVISAYSPINILGHKWGILSEIDQEEAFSHQDALIASIIQTTILIAMILLVIMGATGVIFTRIMTRPIEDFSKQVETITENKDLSVRISIKGNNEFSILGSALNNMLTALSELIDGMRTSAETLSGNSKELSTTADSTTEKVQIQNQEVNAAATATTQLTSSISEVAKNAEMAAVNMNETKTHVQDSANIANQTQADIHDLESTMETTIQAMAKLEEESQSIATVLDVIQNIAEQTNLLALNAAIEAARAGEQGRGFAVVADEVRTLASRTAKSTDEIRSKIDALQHGVEHALTTVQQSQVRTQSSIKKIESTVDSMTEVTGKVDEVDAMNIQIATAAEQQSQVTEEINRNVLLIKQLSDDILEYADSILNTSKNVKSVSKDIYKKIDRFTT